MPVANTDVLYSCAGLFRKVWHLSLLWHLLHFWYCGFNEHLNVVAYQSTEHHVALHVHWQRH
jgi:hypothetical protein